MADNIKTRQFLDFQGLGFYDSQLKRYFAVNNKAGVVGYADKAGKLAQARKIELIGGVTGDGTFDGSNNITINTTLNISGTLNADISGNAATAANFSSVKPINIIGDVAGYGTGGVSSDGWTVPVTLADAAVSNVKLAGGITNDKLVNSSITLGSTNVALGGAASDLAGLTTVTASTFVGTLTGSATSAVSATKDASGNVITDTYATKAELSAAQSAFNFKGSVPTYQDLPANPSNGDIYNVEVTGSSYIWSSTDQAWSSFGSSYGPATSNSLGLVQIGSNITNTNGIISVSQTNVDTALGYEPVKSIRVNGTALIPAADRSVNIQLPNDYLTRQDILNEFTSQNILSGLGYTPIENVSVNGTDLSVVNRRVNIDLSDYATQTWTQARISAELSSLYTFQGSLSTYGDLLNIQNPAIGDTYNLITGNDPDTGNPDWPAFVAGTNFSWDGDEWDSLGGSIDLSDYYKKNEVDTIAAGKAALSHTHNSLYYTKSEVDALLSDMRTYIGQQIAAALSDSEDSGETNDVRTYASTAAFPVPGVPDVIYIDAQTGLAYVWLTDPENPDGGSYGELNNRIASTADIQGLFNS